MICCTACGASWPETFKFCPADGTDLDALRAAVKAAADKTDEVPATVPQTAALPKGDPRAFLKEKAAKAAKAKAEPDRAGDTVLEMRAFPANVAALAAAHVERTKAEPKAGGARRNDDRTLLETPALSIGAAGSARAKVPAKKAAAPVKKAAAPVKKAAAPAKKAAAPAKKKTPGLVRKPRPEAAKKAAPAKSSKFSETQWFMKGISLDADAIEAEGTDADYTPDGNISETERRKFTLRKKDE